ncbi:hypothetical protein C8R45DRAFT_1101702 [Mycena sanguinolenta]|nr:hypothetical protein C8R45DRAFT_1101702 [Mycena sanguinolenta]
MAQVALSRILDANAFGLSHWEQVTATHPRNVLVLALYYSCARNGTTMSPARSCVHPATIFSSNAAARPPTHLDKRSCTFCLNKSLAHSVPLPSSASFTLEGEEDALVPTLRNALLDTGIIHVHVHGGPMLHRHRDTYPRLQWTTQTVLDLLPPLILLLLRIVILVSSSISTATDSPSSLMPIPQLPLPPEENITVLVPAVLEEVSAMRARDGVTARLRLPVRRGSPATVRARRRLRASRSGNSDADLEHERERLHGMGALSTGTLFRIPCSSCARGTTTAMSSAQGTLPDPPSLLAEHRHIQIG